MSGASSLGHTCVEDANCEATQYCKDNSCTDRLPLNGQTCTQDNQCRSTQYCGAQGTCADRVPTVAASPCVDDDNCLNGYCKNGSCESHIPTGQAPCMRGSQCPTGFCKAGTCSVLPTVDEACGVGLPGIFNLCDTTSYCDTNTSKCVARVTAGNACGISTGANAVSQCELGAYCNFASEKCQSADTAANHSCLHDINCPSGQYCSTATASCKDTVNAGDACSEDEACPNNYYCKSGTCTIAQEALTANSCAGNADEQCSGGYCNGTTCTPHLDGAAACTRNAQCSSGFICATTGNTCSPHPGTDSSCLEGANGEYLCPSGQYCDSAAKQPGCKTFKNFNEACNSSDRCGSGLFCNPNTSKCETSDTKYGSECRSHLNCLDNQFCNSINFCQGQFSTGRQCSEDRQCATGVSYCDAGSSVCRPKGNFCTNKNDNMCTVGMYCDNGTCKAQLADLATCDRGSQCTSGFCFASTS